MPRRVLLNCGAALLALTGASAVLVSQDTNFALANVPEDDLILKAMRDEMERSRQLRVLGGDTPYYFSFSVTDADNLRVSASMGAVYNQSRNRFRAPSIEVRVGSYDFDQTGHIFSGVYTGTRYDSGWPIDDSYDNFRQALWLGTDVAYKAALESISRKRASLKNAAAAAEALPDFSKAPPVVSLTKISKPRIDENAFASRTAQASGVFRSFPEVLTSGVELMAINDTTYQMTSEGTAVRYKDDLNWIYAKAEGQAKDGMLVHDFASFQALDSDKIPSEADLRQAFTAVGENVRSLSKAPLGDSFSGPVLFEPQAAAQLMAQLIGDNLRVPRRPLVDPGRPANYQPSELETRVGSRILPEWIDITDDSTQKAWNGKPLVGFFEFDLEGVAPKPVNVVEKGVLKNFLTTRQPVKGFLTSNGHARLSGNYGARTASPGNLFIKASQTTPMTSLRQRLMDLVKERSKPYGMVVRKLDYPYSGSAAELQALAQASIQGGAPRPLSPPLLIYRVYPDGREELVRGLRFRNVSTRTLRDVMAASVETTLFDFVNTTAPLAILGSGGYLAPVSVVSPALLFDELEFETPREQLPRPPIVPPPPAAQ